ncbi:hypothetical protein AJ80_09845 [Polytolypa hystricis UAMH7299]|uniref:C2H2-type domain-containing protein n=1 Tax=Polytolypa hystricis (strain UAMH7299) TaxID=1447883 RepID=A0A2B7WIG9_POLH7|nr:hypothetical protein AJ80_09845 [Polytolypa hystricis UAMH7299]
MSIQHHSSRKSKISKRKDTVSTLQQKVLALERKVSELQQTSKQTSSELNTLIGHLKEAFPRARTRLDGSYEALKTAIAEGPQYRCQNCSKTYTRKQNLNRHYREKHNLDPPDARQTHVSPSPDESLKPARNPHIRSTARLDTSSLNVPPHPDLNSFLNNVEQPMASANKYTAQLENNDESSAIQNSASSSAVPPGLSPSNSLDLGEDQLGLWWPSALPTDDDLCSAMLQSARS